VTRRRQRLRRLAARPSVEAWLTRSGRRSSSISSAEILGVVLITTDRRLAAASGPTCRIDAF